MSFIENWPIHLSYESDGLLLTYRAGAEGNAQLLSLTGTLRWSCRHGRSWERSIDVVYDELGLFGPEMADNIRTWRGYDDDAASSLLASVRSAYLANAWVDDCDLQER
jgi:hypothetical protein